MSDSVKPFACSSPGCKMSFTNEDHLTVHKKKHDMILNLGSGAKGGAFIADQTPTPTRFIRTCEEVGLFQDLQNLNPFEETFRRAVEGKIGCLPDTDITTNDDTLNTPQVFSHLHDTLTNKIVSHMSADVTSSVINSSLMLDNERDKVDALTVVCDDNAEDIMIVERITKNTESIVIQEADTSIIPQSNVGTPASSNLTINGEEVQLLLQTKDGKLMQLAAIPVAPDSSSSILQACQSQSLMPQTVILNAGFPLKTSEAGKKAIPSQLSLAKMKLRQTLKKNGSNSEPETCIIRNENNSVSKESVKFKKKGNDNYIDVSSRKQEILARNRASSMRSRAKRKEWINQLQNSLDSANQINAKLQKEVNTLRSEVTRLKAILLAHKECPLTRVLPADDEIIVDPKIMRLPLTTQYIQAGSISSDDLSQFGVKRAIITTDTPIVAKRPHLMPSSKQSILLPKLNENSISVVTKVLGGNTSGTMNVLDVGQIASEKSCGEPIFVVHNSPQKKMQVINSRQIVQVDQSLELINVASKSTGS